MSLAQLLNIPATITRRLPGEEENEYGDPIPVEEQVEVVCEVQQLRRDEPGDQGELSDTQWIGIFPAGTELRTGDAVRVEGIGDFEVVGDSWAVRNPRTQQANHVEASLRRTVGNEEGS